ncbi:IclR family transcriptional regulator [Pseudarthrobacter phenanthrenivorans]|uniref:IclR family transcriptional regulator n=1 Tax=Pseudarthrobacter phenanthrenivorans TaxID=361575 RepID=A0A3B0FPW6_PSEPS|nr:IclR family transcriptional regulator [Pseudarthrobacter phenanthrenivorans]RKO23742.1 IclR family transcriptional regulator [Pseudarthrobacter phenanthrenivorans]
MANAAPSGRTARPVSAPARPKAADGGASAQQAASVTSRALALLGTFDAEHSVQSLSAMARRAGLPVATAHRLAGELVAWGGLEKANGEYRVGQRIWRLGLLAPAQQNIAEVAAPFMQDVLFVTHNVVNLFILDGQEVLLVERMSGTGAGQPFRRVGARLPLHASAAGKIMLAYGAKELLTAAVQHLEPHTPRTITSAAALAAEVERVRASGYATTEEEAGPDNYGLAVPVFLPNKQVVAALGIVTRSRPAPAGSVVPVLNIAARGIARRLGVEHLPQ